MKQTVTGNGMESLKELLLHRLKRPFQSIDLLRRILTTRQSENWSTTRVHNTYLVIHEETVVEIKGVVAGIVDEREKRFETFGIQIRLFQIHGSKNSTNRVCDELASSGLPVVLFTHHLQHTTAFVFEEIQERLDAARSFICRSDPHTLKHKGQLCPGTLSTVRTEHGMGAENVQFRR